MGSRAESRTFLYTLPKPEISHFAPKGTGGTAFWCTLPFDLNGAGCEGSIPGFLRMESCSLPHFPLMKQMKRLHSLCLKKLQSTADGVLRSALFSAHSICLATCSISSKWVRLQRIHSKKPPWKRVSWHAQLARVAVSTSMEGGGDLERPQGRDIYEPQGPMHECA